MLTRRGWAVAAVAVGGFAMAAWFSARSLNAVVGPALLVLGAGWLQSKRADQPELRTETPEYGFADETVTASLDFDAATPTSATVRLRADDGLAVGSGTVGTDAAESGAVEVEADESGAVEVEADESGIFETGEAGAVETTVADEPVTFAVELRDRGVRSVGPVEVVAEDVFGVWRTTYTYPVSRDVVVFPTIHRLTDAGELAALHREFGAGGRDRFDGLREYERGDPLRDVHWKSSAKRPDDLVVMEFAASEERERVELLAEADGGRMDEVAEAAASVAAYLLDAGFAVGLTVPGDRVEPGVGPDHRTDLLTVLARTYPGTVGDARREDTDVLVRGPADADAVEITVGGRTVTFDQLTGTGREESASTADGAFEADDASGMDDASGIAGGSGTASLKTAGGDRR